MNLSDLPRAFHEDKTFMFLGAGSAICERFPPRLSLPLGNGVMQKLLEARFPKVAPEERVARFQTTYSDAAPTPDSVWFKLVQEDSAMREYYTSLLELFGNDKPVPPSYYKFARWFFTAAHSAGAATTNFDERLDAAIHSIAVSAQKQFGMDYYIASIPEDFSYHSEAKTPYRHLVQKIHGTISRPWSIVAGFKSIAEKKKLRGANPMTSYDVLIDALKQANNWVFVGYSFADPYLKDFLIKNAPNDHKRIYVVSPDSTSSSEVARFKQQLDTARTGRKGANIKFELISATAESFFDHILPGPAQDDLAIVSLPSHEKIVLREGPAHLGEDCKGRFTGRGYSPGKDYVFPDPIYGSIKFSPEIAQGVLQFIDTGEIQRLRYIKQLSFAHLKFPTALHDRFSHTLGVTYLADRCLDKMNRPGIEHALGQELDGPTRLALCVACVMHDSGHGPLGHTLDTVKTRLGLNRPHELDSIRLYEASSQALIFADLDKAHDKTGVSKATVLEILRGSHPLSPLLSNRGLDLDRLDFVLRDAYHATLALPDLHSPHSLTARIAALAGKVDHILQSTRLVRLLEPEMDPHTGKPRAPTALIVDPAALSAVQEVASIYATLYDQVYYCWQNACAQTMVGLALEELIHSHKFSIADVLRLTDMELFTALEEFENPRVKELAYLVKYRRLYELAGEIHFESKMSEAEARRAVDVVRHTVCKATPSGDNDPLRGPFDVMFAIRPAKDFVTSALAALDFDVPVAMKDIQFTSLSKTPGRIYIFKWPESRRVINLDEIVNQLRGDPNLPAFSKCCPAPKSGP